MRYLRMLHNSILGGALGAAYLTILVLQLNPAIPAAVDSILPLYLTLALSYGVHFAVIFYVLIVLRQLVASEVASPGWVSFSLVAWLSTAAAAMAAALMWMNLRSFTPVLAAETARRMGTGAVGLTLCAILFLLLALVHYSFGRHGSRVGATLLALTIVASLSLPLAARGPAVRAEQAGPALDVSPPVPMPAAAPRVLMILLDGASLDFISSSVSDGRLPNFGKLLDGGAAMHLATLRPTQPGPVWAAVATGKLPAKNGVRAAALYGAGNDRVTLEVLPDYCFSHALVRFGLLTTVPHTSAAWRASPWWHILSGVGIPVGIVAWPLTEPARPVRGYIVGDGFHLAREASLEAGEVPVVYPLESLPFVRAAAEAPASMMQGAAAVASASLPALPGGEVEQPFGVDFVYERIAADLQLRYRPQVSAVRYRALDTAGHFFLRYAMPRAFGDVSEEERRRYGQVLVNAYGVIDELVGRAIESLGPDDLLLVVSGFGMQPLGLDKRLLERVIGTADLTGTHESAPDGFLVAYGTAVERGRRTRASVVDVVPTVLYYLGLPVARDMDGYARTDMFRNDLIRDRPITFIPTYDR